MTGANRMTDELAITHITVRDKLYIDFTPLLEIKKNIEKLRLSPLFIKKIYPYLNF